METQKINKKKRKFLIGYLCFVAVLAVCIAGGLVWIWNACDTYQKNSASTVVEAERARLSEELGTELTCDMVPQANADGTYGFTLKNGDVKTAKVILEQSGTGIMNLAMYRLSSVEGLVTCDFVGPEGCSAWQNGKEQQISAQPYVFIGTENLAERGFELPQFYRYTVSGLFSTEGITIKNSGEEQKLTELKNGLCLASNGFDEETALAIRRRVNKFNEAYAYYMSKHVELGYLYSYIASGSRLFGVFSSMDVEWYSAHSGARFSDEKTSEPIMLGERYALVNSSFDFDLVRFGNPVTIPTSVCWIAYKDNYGTWKMLDLRMNLDYDLEMSEIN